MPSHLENRLLPIGSDGIGIGPRAVIPVVIATVNGDKAIPCVGDHIPQLDASLAHRVPPLALKRNPQDLDMLVRPLSASRTLRSEKDTL